ncbi:MAG: hypothetical protein IPL27_21980 [Lewinellaceae bacterium]|nr:hypothetical protein [Lewinellaceae bacterium]
MKQLIFSIFALFVCGLSLSAQESSGRERITNQQNPLATESSRDSFEIVRFDRRLNQLRAAFTAQDMGKVIENNRFLLLAMRNEMEQLEGKIAKGAAAANAPEVLTNMNALLTAFEGHVYDFSKSAEAEKHFERFGAFLELMQK